MRVIVFVALVLASCVASPGQTAHLRDALSEEEKQEVRTVYFGKRPAPDFLTRLEQLRSSSAGERQDAARWLIGVVDLTIADERNRTASWHAIHPKREERTYFDYSEAPPATFFDWVVAALKAKDYGEAAVPAIRHALLHGPDSYRREVVMDVARRWKGPGTDALILELIGLRSLPARLRRPALEEAAKRKLPVKRDVLTSLAHDLDGGVRKAARRLMAELNYPEPAPFDYAAAAHSARFRTLWSALARFVPCRPPPDARFLCVTLTFEDHDGQKPTDEFRGWFLAETHDRVSLYTPNGEWTDISRKLGTVTVRGVSARAEAERLTRFGIDSAEASSSRPRDLGLMAEQRSTWGVSAYEIHFADWLLRRGEEALAARILLPTISYLDATHRPFSEAVCNVMGEALTSQIIGQFVIERNDAIVRRAAMEAIRTQPNTDTGRLAERMLAELPRRADDYRALTLPTPSRWKALRATLSREEQIRHLLTRFRLINAYYEGRLLFGNKFDNDQYSGPTVYHSFLLSASSRSVKFLCTEVPEGHEVINPYRELLGKWDYEKGGRTSGLGLSFADLPVLLPFLGERWFTRIGGSFREWWIDDTLVPLMEIVNDVAGFPLLDEAFTELDDAARRDEVSSLIQWAREYRHRPEHDRLLWALRRGVERRPPGSDSSRDLLSRLVELKHVPAIPDILRIAETHPMHGPSIELALDTAMELNRDITLEAIRPWIESEFPVLRLFAGYAVLEAGDIKSGRRAVADGLQFGRSKRLEGARYERAVKPLLREGSPESIAVARLVFEGDELVSADRESYDRKAVLEAFAQAGLPDAHRYYLGKLRRRPVRNGVQERISGLPTRAIRTPYGLTFKERRKDILGDLADIGYVDDRETAVVTWLKQEIVKREAKEHGRDTQGQ